MWFSLRLVLLIMVIWGGGGGYDVDDATAMGGECVCGMVEFSKFFCFSFTARMLRVVRKWTIRTIWRMVLARFTLSLSLAVCLSLFVSSSELTI